MRALPLLLLLLAGVGTPVHGEKATPSQDIPQLAVSKDAAINSHCQLTATQDSLKQLQDKNKQKELIEKFNQCVKAARVPVTEGSAGRPLDVTGIIVTSPGPGTPADGGAAPADGGAAPVDAGGKAPGAKVQTQLTQGQQLTGSAYGTPDACATGTAGALAAKGILYIHRALVLPREASDDFGYRLGKRFMVYQVSITNASPDFQYAVSDIVVDLKPIFDIESNRPGATIHLLDGGSHPATFEASSQDLLTLRGVPEKGQDYDPRNMTLHIFQGVGAVGAGISGLTSFSDVMGSAMANFNGAFIQAFTGIAPDHTATQLNRLSDMAFTSNTLIGKLQTKKFAVFIPEALIMPKADQKTYWKDPRTELDDLPFDQLNVCVDGILLVQASPTPDPSFSPAQGKLAAGTKITIADTDANATIYYTIDGTPPTTTSPKFDSKSQLTVGAVGTPALVINAIAVSQGKSPSNVVSGTFTPQ